ncbi:isoprenylcysteine carboxylmethyltransferase family protein [Sulfolobus sp. S-194]|uniref:methyltransferase family protein n=1 Tax=Sulfolobus sp. S-194 TaxID=2512240 RepID=UPI0014371190|nr:isoprenylcysteine carboxylmethyltransferase family protein [Sulfolobus sp. S-194]QIW24109.1 isoprenylcysteine carboxylmethyltransferase family protein [Sulfolobus sp. S-194]
MIPIFETQYNEDLFYAVYFIVFSVDLIIGYGIMLMRRRAEVRKREFSTFLIFIGALFFTIFFSFFFGYYSYFSGIGELPEVFIYIGLILMIAGESFRLSAILTLGKYFSPIVTVYSDQRVISWGPYNLVRHPAYGGAIILLLGVALSLRSLFSLSLILIDITVYNYRANLEERLLTQNLGEEYLNYKKRVKKKFIPYVL